MMMPGARTRSPDSPKRSTHLDRPAVAIGKANYTGPSGQWVIPEGELNLVTLYHQNRFANNSVLLAREILDRFGLYDPHLAMRRLCDWDLWLRLIKHIPFVVVDEIIADVYESNPGSIGTTVPWDLALFRYLHDIPRDALLTPAAWHDYQVDSLTIGGIPLAKDFRRRVWTHHILPYYLRFRAKFPQIEGFQPSLPGQAKTVLYTKNSYDVSNDITLNNFDTARRPARLLQEPLPDPRPGDGTMDHRGRRPPPGARHRDEGKPLAAQAPASRQAARILSR